LTFIENPTLSTFEGVEVGKSKEKKKEILHTVTLDELMCDERCICRKSMGIRGTVQSGVVLMCEPLAGYQLSCL